MHLPYNPAQFHSKIFAQEKWKHVPCTEILSSFIHKSPKGKNSVSQQQPNGQIVTQSSHGILLHKDEWTLVTHSTLMNLKNTGLSERSSDTNGTNGSIFMKFLRRQNSHDKKQSSNFVWIWGWWEDCFQKACEGTFWRCIDVLYLDCGGRGYPEYIFVKFTELIFLKGMPLLYINYVNKVDLKVSQLSPLCSQSWESLLCFLKTHVCPCFLGQHPAQCQVYNSTFSSQGPLLVVFFFFFK